MQNFTLAPLADTS